MTSVYNYIIKFRLRLERCCCLSLNTPSLWLCSKTPCRLFTPEDAVSKAGGGKVEAESENTEDLFAFHHDIQCAEFCFSMCWIYPVKRQYDKLASTLLT